MTKVVQAVKRNDSEIMGMLHPLVKEWFFAKFESFSITQQYGVPAVWERKNILISAPTGGTKTLTAFLSIINYLVGLAEKNQLDNRIYAVYISPLKALSNDIHKNLVEPLAEINELAKKKGIKLQEIRVGLRTGDTTEAERAKMARKAPHIFITTPESLAIILTSKKFSEYLTATEFCIIDEIHALDNKRGTYLSISLERLNKLSSVWPVKVGLSATVEPLEEVARFLVGMGDEREVEIAKVPLIKTLDIKVLSPVKNLIGDVNIAEDTYNVIHDLVKEHKTTLIFTNTRAGTERVVNRLKDKFPTEYTDNIAAHHSSLSKAHRFNIEERLRNGDFKVVVCSTSLELGIDIGYIDLVIMLGSPKASSRALQRIGRAGHKLHEIPKGRFVIMDRDDLVECAVIQKEMIEKKIDKIRFPRNCLDVLSQQIYGMAISQIWDIEELFSVIRNSYCYYTLSKNDFYDVISYLAGEYDLEKNYIYGKIWYDKDTKQVGKKGKMARVMYLQNIGTIPEESFIDVKIAPAGEKIGVIDEGFMERMKKGDVFVLGGNKYVYLYSRGMNIYVHPAVNRNPTIPSWFSEMLPLSIDSANEINNLRSLVHSEFKDAQKSKIFGTSSSKESNELKEKKTEHIKKVIAEYLHMDVKDTTTDSIYQYFEEQAKFLEIPNSRLILIEKYKGEKNYLLVHSMYGRRVNDALSRALGFLMGHVGNRDIEIGINDNGFYFAGERMNFDKALEYLTPQNIEEILVESIERTDVLARRFRHCASRALMILRTYKGQNRSVGKQQMKSHFLLAAVKKVSKNFPILKEARREVMEDLMDIENAKIILKNIKDGIISVKIVETQLPSPFALGLIIQGHSDLIKIEDKQAFLKRMHELHVKAIGE
jgi:ATP-dependent Lhr-like helicase